MAVEGHERILFVDDEEVLARWGQLTLEPLGYRVVACTSGPEALEVFRGAPHAFDLLVTDQTMPGMTGDVLAREAWQIRPDLSIILCTGTSMTMTPAKAGRLGMRAYLVKPLMKQDLSRAIREVLDHRNVEERSRGQRMPMEEPGTTGPPPPSPPPPRKTLHEGRHGGTRD